VGIPAGCPAEANHYPRLNLVDRHRFRSGIAYLRYAIAGRSLYESPLAVQLLSGLDARTVAIMTAHDDLTGRARIRNAALAAFAEEGDAASIRGIAQRAGCSPALVQHHYGTKEGLREACDEHVMEYFREQVAAGVDELRIADPGYLAEVYRSAPVVIGYLIRRLVENSPKAQWLFDSLVDVTEPYLGAGAASPVRDRAAVLVAMKLGLLLLRPYLNRSLGLPESDRTGEPRISAAQLDLFAADLAPAEVMAAARRAIRTEASA
jgi:AcrR family transcriptional regulator